MTMTVGLSLFIKIARARTAGAGIAAELAASCSSVWLLQYAVYSILRIKERCFWSGFWRSCCM